MEVNILFNVIFYFFYHFAGQGLGWVRYCFFVFPLAFNILSFFYRVEFSPISDRFDFYSEEKIKICFLIFWFLLFFLDLKRSGMKLENKRERSLEPLFWMPFISVFEHNYFFINTFIFIFIFILINHWVTRKKPGHIHILIPIIVMAQFLFLNGNRVEYGFDDLVFSDIFQLENMNVMIMIIPFFIFVTTIMGNKNASLGYFVKLAFVTFMIRISDFIEQDNISLYVSYVAVFMSMMVLMPFKKVDMTQYLFAVSFAFMMDKEIVEFLPLYYLVAIGVGEIINILVEKGYKQIRFIGGLFMLPYVNPLVTGIFSHLNNINIVMAFVFVLYYAKHLTFAFVEKRP